MNTMNIMIFILSKFLVCRHFLRRPVWWVKFLTVTWFSCMVFQWRDLKVSIVLFWGFICTPATPINVSSQPLIKWSFHLLMYLCPNRYHGGGVCWIWPIRCLPAQRESPGDSTVEIYSGKTTGQCSVLSCKLTRSTKTHQYNLTSLLSYVMVGLIS